MLASLDHRGPFSLSIPSTIHQPRIRITMHKTRVSVLSLACTKASKALQPCNRHLHSSNLREKKHLATTSLNVFSKINSKNTSINRMNHDPIMKITNEPLSNCTLRRLRFQAFPSLLGYLGGSNCTNVLQAWTGYRRLWTYNMHVHSTHTSIIFNTLYIL